MTGLLICIAAALYLAWRAGGGGGMSEPFRIEVVMDKPARGMWHCGPNPSWVTVTHLPTMIQARALPPQPAPKPARWRWPASR